MSKFPGLTSQVVVTGLKKVFDCRYSFVDNYLTIEYRLVYNVVVYEK